MKLLTLALLVMVSNAFAGVIDLSKGFNGNSPREYLRTIKNGQRVVVELPRAMFIETMTIAAIGKQAAYSFGKVYADGQEIATLGVPGRDPIYPITVKEKVNVIEVIAEAGSKFKITDFKLFTGKKNYSSYNSRRPYSVYEYSEAQWGTDVLAIVSELNFHFGTNHGPTKDLFMALKKAAMKLEASDRIRDARSIRTYNRAKKVEAAISAVEEYLFSADTFFMNDYANMLIIDLLTIKEDIAERYDLEL